MTEWTCNLIKFYGNLRIRTIVHGTYTVLVCTDPYYGYDRATTDPYSGGNTNDLLSRAHYLMVEINDNQEVTGSPLATNLSKYSEASRRKYFQALFEIGDTDNNKSLDKEEVKVLLSHSKFNFKLGTVEEVLAKADLNQDGVIDLDEFVALMCQHCADVSNTTRNATKKDKGSKTIRGQSRRVMIQPSKDPDAAFLQLLQKSPYSMIKEDDTASDMRFHKRDQLKLAPKPTMTKTRQPETDLEAKLAGEAARLLNKAKGTGEGKINPTPGLEPVQYVTLGDAIKRAEYIGDYKAKTSDPKVFSAVQEATAEILHAFLMEKFMTKKARPFGNKPTAQMTEPEVVSNTSAEAQKMCSIAKQIFEEVDEDEGGTVDGEELDLLVTKLWEALGHDPPSEEQVKEEVQHMLHLFDENNDGEISYQEFLAMLCVEPWSKLLPAGDEPDPLDAILSCL